MAIETQHVQGPLLNEGTAVETHRPPLTHEYSVHDATRIFPLMAANVFAEHSDFSMHTRKDGESVVIQSGNERTHQFFSRFLTQPVPELLTRAYRARGGSNIDVTEDPMKDMAEAENQLNTCEPRLAGRIVATYVKNKLTRYSEYEKDTPSLNGDREPLHERVNELRIAHSRLMLHGDLPFNNQEEVDEVILNEIRSLSQKSPSE